MTEIREVDALDYYWRPGGLPRWALWTVAAATATTILIAHLGAWHLAGYLDPGRHHTGLGLREGPTIAVAVALALAWGPRWRLSRAVRAAVLLPLVQLAAIGASQWIWQRLAPRVPDAFDASPLVRELPFPAVVAAACAYVLFAGRAIAGRRRGEWLHASAMLALVQLLLVGLWAPIVANAWTAHGANDWYTWQDVARAIVDPRLVAWMLVPPVAIATAFTAIAIRRYDMIRRQRGTIATVTAILAITAVTARLHIELRDSLLYANFVHVLLALAVVAGGALIVLAGSLWLRQRVIVDGIAGTIEGDGAVACMQIDGWLRGPRMVARPFTVVTDAGAVVVPGGATIACSPPDTSTLLRSDEALPILRGGDRVVLAGFVAPPADHPFRGSTALVPGPRVWVARAGERPAGFAGVALAMWRPSIAYLLVAVAIAVPALAGALAAG